MTTWVPSPPVAADVLCGGIEFVLADGLDTAVSFEPRPPGRITAAQRTSGTRRIIGGADYQRNGGGSTQRYGGRSISIVVHQSGLVGVRLFFFAMGAGV